MDRIRDLVESLSGAGVQSPYLDRLREKTRAKSPDEGLKGLQQEILGEMAAALGRSETHVDEALLQCELIGREIDELEARRARGEAVGAELDRAIDAFNAARAMAQRRRWELMVHREALGILRHDVLSQFYPIPHSRERSPR